MAVVFAGLTLGVYLKRGWTRHIEQKNAPESAPVNVERQSTHLTFSKGEGTQKEFTVEASKSIDFKGLNTSDLEGVKITIFGKAGTRHDTMESHACRYRKDSGDIVCAGDVEIILMSAEQWKSSGGKPGAPGTMRIETRGMAFNRASGQATTGDRVQFSFAGGTGQAVGGQYHSEEGTLRLERDVHLTLDQPPAPDANHSQSLKKEPVDITGSRMDFSRDQGTIYLSGPALAQTPGQRLAAAAMLLELDGNFRAKRLTAKSNGSDGRPQFIAEKGQGRQELTADEIAANFAPQGWIRHAEASGNVRGESRQGEQIQRVQARNAAMDMVAGQNAPRLLRLTGAVDARSTVAQNQAGDARRLTTEELRLVFAEQPTEKEGKAGKERGTRLTTAESPGPGRLELNDAATATSKAWQTLVQADHLAMRFDGAGKASRMDAKGHVHTERATVGAEKQTANARNGFIELQPQGGWSFMDLSDDVKLNEGTRAAQADHAEFARAEQTVTLTGHAMARDASTRTSAKKLTLWQDSGDLRGEGAVHSTDLSARGAVQLALVASNVSADQLTGNSKTGRALYTGHARLWQGDSVLEGDSIELLKNERMMIATGNVRAAFPQAPGKPITPAGASQKPVLWHAQSAKMTYWDQENRARLEQNVLVESPDEKITAQTMELFFLRVGAGTPGTAPPTSPAANSAALLGSQQISRAVATGGVTVLQGERRAVAERGEYTAADGKFVMTGGTPTIFDLSEGTTTGRQLTFFLADATIIVDSENGSRTLTKHRVEK